MFGLREIWLPIKGYEDRYEVSNMGRVKSIKNGKNKILKPTIRTRDYLAVNLSNKTAKTINVHTLVAIAFLNHTPNGHKNVIDHIDNDRSNNKADNLQIITARENLSKDKNNGTSKYVGVCWDKGVDKWHAQISLDGRSVSLGRFKNELDASSAYEYALKQLNKPI